MHDKSKKLKPDPQCLPAGVGLKDHNIEFVGNHQTKTVIWLQMGNAHTFDALSPEIYQDINEMMSADVQAVEILQIYHPEAKGNNQRLVELYTYYMWGDLDNTPDVYNGKLQPSENFRDSRECISLGFANKQIDFDGVELNQRDLFIIDSMADGHPDKMIASCLDITMPTLDFHKRNLFKKLKANGRSQAITNSFKNRIISTWNTGQ